MVLSTVAKSPLAVGNVWSSTRPTAFWLKVRPPKEKAFCATDKVRNTSLASYDSDGVRKAKLLVTPE